MRFAVCPQVQRALAGGCCIGRLQVKDLPSCVTFAPSSRVSFHRLVKLNPPATSALARQLRRLETRDFPLRTQGCLAAAFFALDFNSRTPSELSPRVRAGESLLPSLRRCCALCNSTTRGRSARGEAETWGRCYSLLETSRFKEAEGGKEKRAVLHRRQTRGVRVSSVCKGRRGARRIGASSTRGKMSERFFESRGDKAGRVSLGTDVFSCRLQRLVVFVGGRVCHCRYGATFVFLGQGRLSACVSQRLEVSLKETRRSWFLCGFPARVVAGGWGEPSGFAFSDGASTNGVTLQPSSAPWIVRSFRCSLRRSPCWG